MYSKAGLENKIKEYMKVWPAGFNRKEEIWLSALKTIDWDDEWCSEAYMETDYSTLKEEDFIEEMKKHILFKELNN